MIEKGPFLCYAEEKQIGGMTNDTYHIRLPWKYLPLSYGRIYFSKINR